MRFVVHVRRLFRDNNFIPFFIKKLLLRIAVGFGTYDYMRRTLMYDPRLPRCKLADIVVRQDGREVRIEADWLKNLSKIVK